MLPDLIYQPTSLQFCPLMANEMTLPNVNKVTMGEKFLEGFHNFLLQHSLKE